MGKTKMARALVCGMFLALATSGTNLVAQYGGPGVPARPNSHAAVESNPACQRIVSECRRLGFIQGQWRKDNGLWKDCFDPVVRGGTATRDGRPIQVPVDPSDVQACRAAKHR